MPLSRRASKLPARIASTTLPILRTDSLPANWSDVGTNDSPAWLEDQLAQMSARPVGLVGAEDRERLLTLGADLTLAWNSPSVSVETRKKIIRILIHEIIADTAGDKLDLIIHWQRRSYAP